MKYCNIGGQAVLEGVMMKSKSSVATAVRRANGKVEIQSSQPKPVKWVEKTAKIPIVRGAVNMVYTMFSGMRILMDSAKMYGDDQAEEYKPNRFETWVAKTLKVKAEDVLIFFSVALALVLFVGIFILLPSFLTGLLPAWVNGYGRTLCEGVIRIALFLAYIYGVSFMKDIQRTFMYHGAEHKVLYTYEHEQELTVENAAKMSRLHPRCGTSFLLIIMILSILVYGLFPVTIWWERVLVRVLMLPVVAGLSYEVLKLLAKSEHWLVRALRAPGLALQRLTTKEPTPEMLEVSLAAFKRVLVLDGVLPAEEDPEYAPPAGEAPEMPAEAEGSEPLTAPAPETAEVCGAPACE